MSQSPSYEEQSETSAASRNWRDQRRTCIDSRYSTRQCAGFLRFWGPKLYGEWLVLSAIPIYLGLTDFGFGSVAATEMTMLVARGKKEAALEVFQSTWLLTTAVSLSIGLCVAFGLWAFPVQRWVHVTLLSRGQLIGILCVLSVYVLLDLQWTVIVAGFRSDGNYTLGTHLGNIGRFATNASSIVAVASHASPLLVAVVLVAVRLISNWSCQIVLRRKSPWVTYGYRYAELQGYTKIVWTGLGLYGVSRRATLSVCRA